jgi:hypothetical protein
MRARRIHGDMMFAKWNYGEVLASIARMRDAKTKQAKVRTDLDRMISPPLDLALRVNKALHAGGVNACSVTPSQPSAST